MECQQPPEEGNSAKEAGGKKPWKGLEENWSFPVTAPLLREIGSKGLGQLCLPRPGQRRQLNLITHKPLPMCSFIY